MGSGARLRSDNAAFGRSRTGTAFLITAEPPPTPLIECIYQGLAGGTTGGPIFDYPPMPTSNPACLCDTIPSPGFAERLSIAEMTYFGNLCLGLGWEDPPHPAVELTFSAAGGDVIVSIGEHCATRQCPGWPFNDFGDYAINLGSAGCEIFVDQASTIEGSVPATFGKFHMGFLTEQGGAPWAPGDPCSARFTFSPATLPDPGPYNIVNAQTQPNNPSLTLLTLDRPVRFNTVSALYIQGTGIYDGMVRGEESALYGEPYTQINIRTAYAGAVTTGTMQRVFDQDWDCWYNDANPQVAPPPLPSPP